MKRIKTKPRQAIKIQDKNNIWLMRLKLLLKPVKLDSLVDIIEHYIKNKESKLAIATLTFIAILLPISIYYKEDIRSKIEILSLKKNEIYLIAIDRGLDKKESAILKSIAQKLNNELGLKYVVIKKPRESGVVFDQNIENEKDEKIAQDIIEKYSPTIAIWINIFERGVLDENIKISYMNAKKEAASALYSEHKIKEGTFIYKTTDEIASIYKEALQKIIEISFDNEEESNMEEISLIINAINKTLSRHKNERDILLISVISRIPTHKYQQNETRELLRRTLNNIIRENNNEELLSLANNSTLLPLALEIFSEEKHGDILNLTKTLIKSITDEMNQGEKIDATPYDNKRIICSIMNSPLMLSTKERAELAAKICISTLRSEKSKSLPDFNIYTLRELSEIIYNLKNNHNNLSFLEQTVELTLNSLKTFEKQQNFKRLSLLPLSKSISTISELLYHQHITHNLCKPFKLLIYINELFLDSTKEFHGNIVFKDHIELHRKILNINKTPGCTTEEQQQKINYIFRLSQEDL